jgi:hypothetical protein
MIQPSSVSLTIWAQSLIIDFPYDNIPFLDNEKEWKVWGNLLIQENTFGNNGAPSTNGFDDVRQWMNSVYLTMANYAA